MICLSKYKKFTIIFFLSVCILSVNAQYTFDIDKYTDSLVKLGEQILNENTDIAKYQANEQFKNLLLEILMDDNAPNIDFSLVKNLSVIEHKKAGFKIFTWVLQKEDYSYECFGIFLYRSGKREKEITELINVKSDVDNPELKIFRDGQWWGAMYYDIIPVKSGGIKYYTLLGWDGNNAFSTYKVIDVLSVSESYVPVFGAQIFSGYGRHFSRIIFEYSSKAQIVLRYEEQAYYVNKKSDKLKKKRRKKHTDPGFSSMKKEKDRVKQKRKVANLIVFDRLAPVASSLTGMYEFYIPQGNIVDGFLFSKGKWNYIPDIDARNLPTAHDKIKRKNIHIKIPVMHEE